MSDSKLFFGVTEKDVLSLASIMASNGRPHNGETVVAINAGVLLKLLSVKAYVRSMIIKAEQNRIDKDAFKIAVVYSLNNRIVEAFDVDRVTPDQLSVLDARISNDSWVNLLPFSKVDSNTAH